MAAQPNQEPLNRLYLYHSRDILIVSWHIDDKYSQVVTRELEHYCLRGIKMKLKFVRSDSSLTLETCKHEYFDFVFITTLCDEVIEIKHKLSDKLIQIPQKKNLDPSSVISLDFDIKVIESEVIHPRDNLLKQVLASPELPVHDIEFKAKDGQLVPAHKFVMSIVSPVVKARFVHDGIQNTVYETDFGADDLKIWIDHIYRRSLIGQDTKLYSIMDVFMVSDYFGTEEVSNHCCKVISDRVSPCNIAVIIEHDMIYLCGDHSAKVVQDAILQVTYDICHDEIHGLWDDPNPRIDAFMPKIWENYKEKKINFLSS